jgi:hypothetical protein
MRSSPPMNLLGPALVGDPVSLIHRAEADDALQVLVLTSAGPDHFISHVDATPITKSREAPAKLTDTPLIAILFPHLSASRLVTIADRGARAHRGQHARTGVRYAPCRTRATAFQPARAGVRPDTWRDSWGTRGRSRTHA